MTGLPPQVRDMLVNEDFDKIPPEYRELIQEYADALKRKLRTSPGR